MQRTRCSDTLSPSLLHDGMSPEDRHILNAFAAAVRERFPDADVLGFGSRVRGEARWDSDLDVCVIVDRPVDWRLRRRLGDIADDIGFSHDRIISLIVYQRAQLEQGPLSASPLVATIREEGVPA
ncbi:MAG: nucleotidyltransferase domain-containing protein [Bacteroidetes bacterium]|jgi:hypothetical protein|nr:nucleotidyltransferase domain-containing protein [Bacteroidota bacterium]